MNIQLIINNTLKQLEREGKLQTPDVYAQTFCKEAQKAGFTTPDCSHMEKLSQTLNKEFQAELKNYRVTNLAELSRFVISRLNRTNPSHCANMLESQIGFTKKILQTIALLHNKEASELAKRSIELLSNEPSIIEIEQFKQSWINFTATYDDSFLEKLRTFGKIDNTNLKESIQNLNFEILTKKKSSALELNQIAAVLISSLVPSIAPVVDEKIANFSQKAKLHPEIIESSELEKEIKELIAIRIALDKKSVKEMIESIDGVLDKLSLRLIEMIESADGSTQEIQKIKDELSHYNEESVENFAQAHKKLYSIASALETNTQTFSENLRRHNHEVSALAKKIEMLEDELKKAQTESKEDFLTKVLNKRALEDVLKIKEAGFKRYGHNFSLIFFDIDHFKAVNDTYGHDAGDEVLSAFAKIIKSELRSDDTVGRFGGEEFIVILNSTSSAGGAKFAEKVREKVKSTAFMYKGERITLTVSAGVSDRVTNSSLQTLLKTADEFMYKAKNDGRDKVVSHR